MPWQQLVDPLCRMIGETRQDIGEPGLRIDIVELARLDQRIDSRGSLTAGVGAGEGPVSTPDGYAPQARSAALFVMQMTPSSRKRVKASHCFRP